MAKAFEAPGEPVSVWKTIGEVEKIDDEYFTGVIEDEEGDRVLIKVLLDNIIETERPRIVRGIMFFCDLQVVPEGETGSIRGIEFSDELTMRENEYRDEIFFGTLAKAAKQGRLSILGTEPLE
jgi:hypothetical protein